MNIDFQTILSQLLLFAGFLGVILLVYMLMRILSEQDKIYKEIRTGTQDLLDAGKRLHEIYALAERLASWNKPAPAVSPPPEPNAESEPVFTESLQKFERLASDMRGLLKSVKTNIETGLSALSTPSAVKSPSQPLLDQKLVTEEFTKMQAAIDRVIQDIKRQNYLVSTENQTLQDLKQKVDSYQRMTIKARERAKLAENTIASMQEEIERLRNMQLAVIPSDQNTPPDVLEELKKITSERDALRNQVDSLTSEIKRTIIEKDFIEGRFIQLS